MSRVRSWTDEEVGWLLDNDHISARAAGEELGRGRQSVQKMRQKLREGGVPLAAWTAAEDDFIASNPDLTISQLAEHLSRTPKACTVRRSIVSASTGISFKHRKEPFFVGDRSLLAKTCLGCGLLLTPKWFGRATDAKTSKRLWRSTCVRCRPGKSDRSSEYAARKAAGPTVADRAFRKRMQEITVPLARNSGQEWTAADLDVLDDPESTALSKALRLGRTYDAVVGQCSKNGFRSLVGHGDPIKGQWVIDNPNAPTPDQSAA